MISMLKNDPCHPPIELNNCSCTKPSEGDAYPPSNAIVSNAVAPHKASTVKSGMVVVQFSGVSNCASTANDSAQRVMVFDVVIKCFTVSSVVDHWAKRQKDAWV